ncbi:MAG: lysophospholipid acyltransferase family protein [Christensenellales bacterium]|jgi:1-acyl-sn-glycerol-3-phosphate acyltransferase
MDKVMEKILYGIVRLLVTVVVTVLYPMRVEGREHLRSIKPPFIAYANHISGLDPLFLAYLMLPYRTSFFAKEELMADRFRKWALRSLGAIPVKRGSADIHAVKTAAEVLKHGEVFAIFPEGTRNRKLNGELQKFRTGVGLIALRSGVPVLPVRFLNDEGFRIFRKARIRVGPPVELSDLYAPARITSDTIAQAVSRMLRSMDKLANT